MRSGLQISKETSRTQIVVLAGGRSKRLGLDIQKCMLEISGRRLIDICIDSLAVQGFGKFALLAGHKSEEVVSHVKSAFGGRLQMAYSVDPPSPDGWGKGKAFKTALERGAIDRSMRAIIVFPDDIILEEGLHSRLLTEHVEAARARGAAGSLVLVPEIALDYGIAEVGDDKLVEQFKEKPVVKHSASVGIYVFEPLVYEIVDELIDTANPSAVDLESTVLPVLVKRHQLAATYVPREKWLPVNTLKEFEKAKQVIADTLK